MVLRLAKASYLAALLAALLLAVPACKQSLFDEHVGSADAGGGGGDGTVPPAMCPEPCVGDAVGHYNGSQGGTSGRWHYLEADRNDTGLNHTELVSSTWHTLTAFVGGDISTAVLPCGDNQDAMECAGIEETLLLSPSETGGTNGTYPVLSWTAPATGEFRVSGDWAGPETYQEGVQERLVIYRNGRNDTLYTKTFPTSHSVAGFDFSIEAFEDDEIRLGILANTSMSIPIGVDFFVTDLTNPGECQLLMTFNDQSDLTDHCNSAVYTNSNDPVNGEPPTAAGPAPPGMPRMARTFVEGSYLRPAGPTMNYSGDFTIQFWFNMASAPWTGETMFADWNCAAQGGVIITRTDSNLWVEMFRHDASVDYCFGAGMSDYAMLPVPTNDVWHFLRVTRSTADEAIYVCVDGRRLGQIPMPADADLSSDTAPWLGRNVDYNPAYFRGSLADVRVFSRALPCPTLP